MPVKNSGTIAVMRDVRTSYERVIISGGYSAMTEFTRSGAPIKRVHGHLCGLILAHGVKRSEVRSEVKLPTFWGTKTQDIVVTPSGAAVGPASLSIGVKGHFYGGSRNVHNSHQGTIGEIAGFHLLHREMVCSHVQLVALSQFDTAAAKKREVAYKPLTARCVSQIIDKYTRMNGRTVDGRDSFIERVALVLVDLSKPDPRVYTTVEELEEDKWLPANSGLSLDGATLDTWAEDVLACHRSRFLGANRL